MIAAAARCGSDFTPAQIKRLQVWGRRCFPAGAAAAVQLQPPCRGLPCGARHPCRLRLDAAHPSPPPLSPSQQAREERLAVLLSALLRRWVEGDEAGFVVRGRR